MSSRASEIDKAHVFSPNQILFPSLSYSSFAYPGDQEALAALSKVPGAPALLTYIQKNLMEEITHAENNKHMIRVGQRNYPSIYKLVSRCAEILSVAVPDIYVTTKHDLNAYTMGQRRTSIVIHSGLIDAMNADELSFVIAHELGHIKCGHGLYRQLGGILIDSWDVVASMIPVPGLGLLRIPLLLAYWEWFQRAELSCDRAGLICIQTLNPALTGLGKLAGHVHGLEEQFHVESVVEQTNVHAEVNKVAMVISILNNATNTHPIIPFRLKQAVAYNDSAEYKNILAGSYVRDHLGVHEGGKRVKCACGQELNVKLQFCPNCGRATAAPAGPPPMPTDSNPCQRCGHILAREMRFCPKCGTSQVA